MSIRTEKVAEEIKHKLNTAMSRDLSEISGIGLVTISKVMISPDLKVAKVYLSFLGNKEPVDVCLEKINEKKKHIRYLLAKHIVLRYMPDLVFFHDDTIEYADKIQKLLNTINTDPKSDDTSTDTEQEEIR
ncbi:MAG TPA: 30S ribosome-binding factor RbfA [Ignavibacteria bacterium]|nr:30S ribosome-binding factor RbfA [Ignavibacteria bacterium]